ncbi:hypothetical protein [Agrobacterium sp. NPDC089420]|uniref:hypothetical protein n=1 Tax=Agrobacterium sp. NPDC089420 TaxID=3363918 RepID=UPI003850B163
MPEKYGGEIDADDAGIVLMLPDPGDERQQDAASQALLKAVCEIAADSGKRVYAVMDGSQYNDLPQLLKEANVAHRPLYRYAGDDYDVILGGPWLVDPYQAAVPYPVGAPSSVDEVEDDLSEEVLQTRSVALSAQMVLSLQGGDPTGGGMLPVPQGDKITVEERLRKILALSQGKPAVVFWSGENDFVPERLYRHLRGLNRIFVPKTWNGPEVSNELPRGEKASPAAESDLSASESVTSAGYEPFIFRHADANVMMQIIPVLDEAQLGHLFGPATQLLFAPGGEWGGGVKRARMVFSPDRPLGEPIIMSKDMMAAVSEVRDQASRRKISGYLERNAEDHLKHMDEEERDIWISYQIREARALGVRSEAGLGRWCYLQAITDGRLTHQPGVTDYMMSKGEGTPDEKVRLLLKSVRVAANRGVNA